MPEANKLDTTSALQGMLVGRIGRYSQTQGSNSTHALHWTKAQSQCTIISEESRKDRTPSEPVS